MKAEVSSAKYLRNHPQTKDMRRHFRPARVYETASALVEAGRISKPQWLDVVGALPPTQALIRTQPLPHQRRKGLKGTRKASKLFQPQRITYEEDGLRAEFFKDHPWELARPRLLLEDDGRDSYKTDWSRLEQPQKALSGESVVQRQRFLLAENKSMTRAQAYDQARKEFYDIRFQEDVERRIAKEEALATGAQFGKSALEIGMELENREFDNWRQWAALEADRVKQRQQATYTASDVEEDLVDNTTAGSRQTQASSEEDVDTQESPEEDIDVQDQTLR